MEKYTTQLDAWAQECRWLADGSFVILNGVAQ